MSESDDEGTRGMDAIAGTERVPRSAWLPFFTPRRLGGRWVLTNRMGDWSILEDGEYQSLFEIYTPRELIERLAERRLVIHGDNPGELLPRWQHWHGSNFDGPSLHIVHLTQRCNLTCSYCHSSAIPVTASGRDLSDEVAVKIIDFIAATPNKRVNIAFQGGEPTLRPDLIELMMARLSAACARDGRTLSAGITTNGTTLSPEVMEVLERYQVRTTVSFDGPRDIHDSIRTHTDGRGSFDEALAGREKVRRESKAPLSGSIMVLTRSSISRVREIVDQYVAFGQHMIRLKPVTRLGRSKATWDDNAIDFDTFWEAYVEAVTYMASLQQQDIMICDQWLMTGLRKLLDGQNMGDVDARNPCGLVYGVLNYDIDGKIHACHEGKRQKAFQLGSVDDAVEDVLMSRQAAQIASASVLDKHPTCRGCSYLPYCTPCPAHAYQQTRDREIVPHESWECLFTLKLHDLLFDWLERDPAPLLAWWRFETLREMASRSPAQASQDPVPAG